MWSNWLNDSRGRVILVLLLLWLSALVHDFSWAKLVYPLVSTLVVMVLDGLITYRRSGKKYFSLSLIITGLLIGLILDPTGSVFLVVAAGILAVLDKQFLRFNIHRHAFNPAALGIVIAAQLLSGNVSWWSVSWGILPVIILGFGMIWILAKLRRLFLPLIFLAVYFLINLTRVGPADSFRLIFDGTVFLFAFIMLPEPVTALVGGSWRYLWGLLVGVWLFVLVKLPIPLADPLLTALLLMNLIGFFWSWRKSKSLSGSVWH